MKTIIPRDLTASVNDNLLKISNFFITEYKKDRDQQLIGLMTGRAGSMFLQSLLYKATGDINFFNEIQENLEFILDELEQSNEISVSYGNGLAGIGWLIIFLSENDLISFETEDILLEIDDVLQRELILFLNKKEFDLLHEALGVGQYFIKRKNIEQVDKIVCALYEARSEFESEIAWNKLDKYNSKSNVYDLGLAHGLAGILYFLGKSYQMNCEVEKCLILINGVFSFYKNNIQPGNLMMSFFPDAIPVEAYKSGNIEQKSRVAWCYGDLGIGYTLYQVASIIKNSTFQDFALNILKVVALKKDYKDTIVSEASFCHGSSGNGIMFLKLYKITQDEDFLKVANFYLNMTIEFGMKDKDIIKSYIELKNKIGSIQTTGLLTGIGGPLLLLIAFNYNLDSISWDDLFFLS